MTLSLRLLLIITAIFLTACEHKERDIKGAAVNTFLAGCVGGGLGSCSANCQNQYGATVTGSNLLQLNTCLSNCNVACSIVTLCLQLQQACTRDCGHNYTNCLLFLGASGVGK
ncbi:putative lipoprotein [Leptospira broomii serovar Hurstbridge str. 5399]|uniref:Lipoprotein n=1 Tax=Leptospira broomii serovar Hurstbridge str. 5399 TaxID=1049789 RepID=T0FI98_9LEPT|nr:hypothetical protein [Leptospira broomii]EQA47322.1 putative lipoprotein [Leptospira broomii serovar Hurstbridge str. 5399]